MILKHPDILTLEEQNKVNRLKDWMLTGIMSGVIAMPYSLYLGMKARKNPSLRSSYIKRMALLPTVPLLIVVVSGYYAEKNFRALSDKYFGHLSDGDLDNFETYYHMLRSGMPAHQQFYAPPQ
jgi:hypothetical protein